MADLNTAAPGTRRRRQPVRTVRVAKQKEAEPSLPPGIEQFLERLRSWRGGGREEQTKDWEALREVLEENGRL
jgi:hypothetical protein